MSLPPAEFWHALADAADAETMRHFRSNADTSNKLAGEGGYDPVTEGDRACERAVRALISDHYPDHDILGEEEGRTLTGEGSGMRWVIDPIDGTRAYVAGLPTWMTLIGLERDGRAVAGLASQPVTGERFLALGDGKATLMTGDASRPISVGRRTDPAIAIAMTTDPHLLEGEHAERHFRLRQGVRLMRYGADAYAFCALAAGTVDIVVEAGVQPYDVGALIPIVEAAGGVFTTWSGERAEPGGNVLAAATPQLHEWAMRQLA